MGGKNIKRIWNIVFSVGKLLCIYSFSFPQSVKTMDVTCGGFYAVTKGNTGCDSQGTKLTIMSVGDYDISNVNTGETTT